MSIENKQIFINLWCGPRTLSTSLMYSFNQRLDTIVYDEPLYASYLNDNPYIYRPYRSELLNSQSIDRNQVFNDILQAFQPNKSIIVCKHMSKHFTNQIDTKYLINKQFFNILILRNPLDMIKSWNNKVDIHNEPCNLDTIGLFSLLDLYTTIKRLTNQLPIIIDSDILKLYPIETLQELCNQINIPFDSNQLAWPSGPKPCDGLWAKYWYDSVHQSTGFNSYESSNLSNETNNSIVSPLTIEQLDLYRDALPVYQLIHRNAIGVNRLNPGSSINSFHSNFQSAILTSSLPDPRNENIVIWVGNQLLPREYAKVSVFDSIVQGGDGVWEGLRIYNRRIFMLDEHINRLIHSAIAMHFTNIPSRSFIINAIVTTLLTNNMLDNSHIRLTLTRGPKVTSSMNPKFNIFGCNLLVVPEWKKVEDITTYNNQSGVSLITSCIRRNSPQCVDSKIHHNNLINNILPKIQANNANAADALMLDLEGFVSETNATNIFMVKDNVVYTPYADSCLPGITRQVVIKIASTILQIPMLEKRLSLTEFYTADEVFTTGTMGEITPVISIDNRVIRYIDDDNKNNQITKQIQLEYKILTETLGYLF